MIEHFKTFKSLLEHYSQLFADLSDIQSDTSPQIFNHLVDMGFKQMEQDKKLFDIENNYKHEIRERKYKWKLEVKEWKKKIKEAHLKGIERDQEEANDEEDDEVEEESIEPAEDGAEQQQNEDGTMKF